MGPFDQLFDHTPFAAFVVEGPERQVVYANEAYLSLVGPRAVIGRPYRDALGDIADQGHLAKIDEVFRTGRPYRGKSEPTRLVGADGRDRTFWSDFVYQPLAGPDGAVEQVLALAYDCTRRIRFEHELAGNERRMAIATRAAGIGVWDWDQTSDVITYSARAREICGYALDAPISVDTAAASTHPDDLPHTKMQSDRARDPGLRERPVYDYRIVRPDGEIRWVRAHGEAVFDGPGPNAACLHYIGTIEDVTEPRAMAERLRQSEARLQLALDAGRMAVFDWPFDEADVLLTPALREVLGVAQDAPSTTRERRDRYHPDDRERAIAARHAALAAGDRYCDFDFRYFRPDGLMRWLQVRSEIVQAPGRGPSLIGVITDVTERKEAEESLDLLARELDHRANNLLAVIQGTVSLSRAEGAEQLRLVIEGRIAALARAHRLLSDGHWKGADLRTIIEQELRPYGLGEQASAAGPDCALSPPQAQALAMALHELATNAVKYGALSTQGGRVSVDWRTDEADLQIDWRETGGPAVTPPERTGLGTTLIRRALGGGLGGGADLHWPPEGVVCRLTLPLQGLTRPDTSQA
ncbi:MAG TPA: PAS domain-containing protein [Caulobacteraceae bacterium]|jgi:PAS domain S-box-containing protein|nr:PAS domain-containing protein [Caulobacteraceae bacterium]